MSRTDKDVPHWVQATRYGVEPMHRCGWIRFSKFEDTDERLPWGGFRRKHVGYRWEHWECTLPTEPPVFNYGNYGAARVSRRTRCAWVYCVLPDDWRQTRNVPGKRFWRRKEFYGPQRMNERRAAQAIKHGDLEHEFPDGRGRHSILWYMS